MIERAVARFAYQVGWAPKGWPVGQPWIGVSTHLRAALFAIATVEGLDTVRQQHGPFASDAVPSDIAQRLAGWNEAQFQRFGALHPMEPGAKLSLHRLTLGLLERLTPEADRLQQVPGTPLVWLVGTERVTLSATDLFTNALPRNARKQLKQAGVSLRPKSEAWEPWLTTAPLRLRLWSSVWLRQLEEVMLAGRARWRVRLLNGDPVSVLALWDTLELLQACTELYGLDWHVPEVELDVPDSEALALALRAYQGHPDAPAVRETLSPLRLVAVDQADRVLGPLEDVDASELHAHVSEEELLTQVARLLDEVDQPFTDFRVAATAAGTLNFLFARYFPYPQLRDEQIHALQRALGGESLLVLLPTGYGKSVIFQLAALVQPGVTLVVSPLNALIRDQMGHLRDLGIVGAGFVQGDGKLAAAQRSLQDFEQGHYRLFYCSPERLAGAPFKKALASILSFQRCSMVALDEAHCVSEWGHDFRPAYLQVKSLCKRLEQDTQHRVPVLALTATASPVVRADIQRALGIPADNVVQTRSSDRPELSYSVHLVDGRRGPAARLQALKAVFSDLMPKLFGADVLTRRALNGRYENGAVVFAPFAKARNRALHTGNVAAVQGFLKREVQPDIGMYAGSGPGQCPTCGSHDFFQNYGTYSCNSCQSQFKKAYIRPDQSWDDQLLATQDAFLSSRLPILVSTKGFGMGIDKPNIRLVAHHVMSGSLEAYAQEAGRAGRNGEHAHIALVTVPPAPDCASRYIDSGRLTSLAPDDAVPLPCLQLKGGWPILECQHGLKDLCDVAQQASMIQTNFPSAQQDHQELQRVFAELQPQSSVRAAGFETSGVQRALSRLQTLGLLRTYQQQGPSFSVNWNRDWTVTSGLALLETELLEFERLSGSAATTLPELQSLKANPPEQQADYVRQAGRLLIDTLYTTVRSMRLYSLVNLYRYAALPAGQCRRVHLRRSFEVTPLAEDYRCGFCDTCQPDLSFELTRAFTPQVLTREEELGRRFEALLDEFSLELVDCFLQDSAEARVTASLLGRTTYLLEQRPNDPGLLFVHAALQTQHGDSSALQTAERAITVMRRVGQNEDQLLSYLRHLETWVPGVIIGLTAAVGGPFDDILGRPLALTALAATNPPAALRLQHAWRLQALTRHAAALLPAFQERSL